MPVNSENSVSHFTYVKSFLFTYFFIIPFDYLFEKNT